jgi:hypothetical protein
MAKLVWKKLSPGDIETLLTHIEGIPESDRPLYGLVGIKRREFLMWRFSLNKRHALYFTNDRVVLSQRSTGGAKEKSRREYSIVDLADVRVIRGPLFESIKLAFRDGFKIKLRDVPKMQSDPVERVLREGTSAFARNRLSDEQITNCYFAYSFARLIPADLLG